MSSSQTDKLHSARLKVQRAKKHILDLDGAINAFLAAKPYEITGQPDPDMRQVRVYVTKVDPVPDELACLAGDAIHNLRSALDHLAYQIFLAGPNPVPARAHSVYFPIFGSDAKYKAEKLRKIQSATQEALDALDAIEPYKGGKGHHLWVLDNLNNVDKHCLVITVCAACPAISYGETLIQHARKVAEAHGLTESQIEAFVDVQRHMPWQALNPNATNLKVGDCLGNFDFDTHPGTQFGFDIAISEQNIVDGAPLLATLQRLVKQVEDVVASFSPVL
jgi:hypothetical protein